MSFIKDMIFISLLLFCLNVISIHQRQTHQVLNSDELFSFFAILQSMCIKNTDIISLKKQLFSFPLIGC